MLLMLVLPFVECDRCWLCLSHLQYNVRDTSCGSPIYVAQRKVTLRTLVEVNRDMSGVQYCWSTVVGEEQQYQDSGQMYA
jgi:hypothetical protein